ncbi:MAG: hypothetical protein QNL10_02845, partial [Crocinitomicaceae bacterium]
MKNLTLICLLVISSFAFAQGDDCSNAEDLGTLPTPLSCFGGNPADYGVGSSITETGSSIGSTAANPYVYMIDCGAGTTDMANGAVDVWYSFVASGTELVVNLTGSMANPNIGLWSGNCLNLVGRGCAIGDAAGNLTESFGPLTIGETYLIQVSGNAPFIQGNFTLELNNNLDCNGCLEVGVLTANPPPINGTYAAGQVVEFCYTITDYNQTNSNWLHGVQVEWSAGWETTVNNVTTTVPPSCGSAGNWVWTPTGTTGSSTGQVFPSGFYFESNGGCFPCDPNNPGDNYGDSGAENCDPEFCWSLTTLPPISCTTSIPLTVIVNTSADSESGSYGSLACQTDLASEFSSMLSCCSAPPALTVVDVSCAPGAIDGSVTVEAVGSALPWTYQWYDNSGTLISTTTFSSSNTNTLSNLAAGSYTAVVTDNTGCSAGSSAVINTIVAPPPSVSVVDVSCGSGATDGSITAQASGTSLPWTYEWYDNTGTLISTTSFSSINTNTISNLAAGDYSVTVTDITGCSATTNTVVNAPSASPPTFNNFGFVCEGEPFLFPTTSLEGVQGTWTPAIDYTVGPTTYTFTPNPGECAIPTTMVLVIRAAPSIDPIPDVIACNGDAIDFNAIINGGASIAWTSSEGAFSAPASISTTFTPSISNGTATVTAEVSVGWCTITTQEVILVTFSSGTTSVFTPIADICPGDALTLPATSDNGITGTWAPVANNTLTTTYTFTPDAGQCATTETMTVNVTTGSTPTFNPIADICSGDPLTLPVTSTNSINGTWSPVIDNTLTTNYTFTPAPGQCASDASMTVVVVQASLGTDTQASCDTYTWIDGNTYTASNNSATFLLTNAAGCDSTVTLDLTITNSTTGTDTQTACDTYTWIDGNTYTASNNSATVLLTNAAGCDSTVTLDLTITNSTTGTDTQTACDTYTWIDGNTYTSSNNSATWLLTNAAGCDSTVTLDLTIANSLTGTDTQTACDTYTWIDGNTYTVSNNSATFLLTASGGCDSTVTLDLTIT